MLKVFPVESKDSVNEKIKNRDEQIEERSKNEDKKKKPIKKVKNLEKLV